MHCVDFCGKSISRLIIGGNPFSGNSHVSGELDEAMLDYYSTRRIKDALFRSIECGINTVQARGDAHIIRIMREFRNEGGEMHFIGQTASEFGSFENSVRMLRRAGAYACYHHGTMTDILFKAGDTGALKQRLAVIRASGMAVGLGSHMPEVFHTAEREKWDVDFHMCCVHNISKVQRESSAVTGKANSGEPFDDEDRAVMYEFIRSTPKPCLAFKILGASRYCSTPETIRGAFQEAFDNIKPTDAIVVGMFQRDKDQVAENAALVSEILERAGAV